MDTTSVVNYPTHDQVSPEPDSEEEEGLGPGEGQIELDLSSPLGLQVHAFIEASDEVDVDQETVEDILSSLLSAQEELPRNETTDLLRPTLNENPWTKQEIRFMKHHLKEKGTQSFVQEYHIRRAIPIPRLLLAFEIELYPELERLRPKTLLYFLRVALSRELQLREKLTEYNTFQDAVELIRSSRRIIILSGAGISVSCGIPDFRSRNGLYSSLKDNPEYNLDDPQQMFDIRFFSENPAVFYSFASKIYPSNFTPSPCHRFIKLVEDNKKLLRNYTQNIDTLETLVGVKNVLQCHGSFATATCVACRRCVPGKEIEVDVLCQRVPLCTVCNVPKSKPKKKAKKKSGWDTNDTEDDEDDFGMGTIGSVYPPGIMKPDITFFGEKLSDEFDRLLAEDRDVVDLLIVIGTSLKVAPVSDILVHLPHSVPQILINKTPVRHINPDIVLLGDADTIVHHLCHELDWELPPPLENKSLSDLNEPERGPQLRPRLNLKRQPSSSPLDLRAPKRVGERFVPHSSTVNGEVTSQSHVWLFEGAEGGQWVQNLEGDTEQLGVHIVEDSGKASKRARRQ